MQEGRHREHAAAFGAGADAYDRHRPSYPEDAVRELLGKARDVLDLGAGTGKLTAELVALGASVTSVDPSADMLRVLRDRLPGVRTEIGSGEDIPAPDASADLVTVAQAWHWLDAEAATAEVLRVLRPNGRLALIWDTRDESVAWVNELSQAMHAGLHGNGLQGSNAYEPHLGTGLEFTSKRVDRWVQQTSRDGILNLATTRSYHLVATPPEQQAMRQRIERVLDSHEVTSGVTIALPYLTQTWEAAPFPDQGRQAPRAHDA